MLNQMYEQYCASRLPCGICRLTNSQCPKACGIAGNWAEVTCTRIPNPSTAGTTVDARSTYTNTTEVNS